MSAGVVHFPRATGREGRAISLCSGKYIGQKFPGCELGVCNGVTSTAGHWCQNQRDGAEGARSSARAPCSPEH